MKLKFTLLFLLSFLVSSIKLSAQRGEIPNGDFQIWDSVPGAGYEDPRGWVTFNFFSPISGVLTCEHGQISGTNDSYMKLISDSIFATNVLSGIAFCGTMDSAGNGLGFPYTKRPDALVGKWQYQPQGNDQGYILAFFTKWNATTNTRDSVGAAYQDLQGSVMNWENFRISINYFSPDNPDTCVVAASSSGVEPAAKSYLMLNDLDFDLGSGIYEQAKQHFKIFPNPASDKIQLDLTTLSDIRSIDLIDLHGKRVVVKALDPGTTSVDVSNLSKGMYLIRVKTKNAIVTEKFNKL